LQFVILLGVSQSLIEIVPCSAKLIGEALELVLRDLSSEQRREIALQTAAGSSSTCDALMIARSGDEICGAAWGQRQPGKTAIYWAPQLTHAAADERLTGKLTQAVAGALDIAGVEMTQTLVSDRSASITPALESAGFRYLAELLYLAAESSSISSELPNRERLEFVAYDDSHRPRLVDLLERTYLDSRDCAAMNGKRQMDDVLDGYRATGVYRPANWLIVRSGERDVGVLLLAEEPAAGHCELIYMGLVPEARGQGLGVEIARHGVRLAKQAGAERVVLAVDAVNGPAVAMYEMAGFTMWDRRTVYVRYRDGKTG
jgi:ribosomal protein S18 acetylase RimI-like enzyme